MTIFISNEILQTSEQCFLPFYLNLKKKVQKRSKKEIKFISHQSHTIRGFNESTRWKKFIDA